MYMLMWFEGGTAPSPFMQFGDSVILPMQSVNPDIVDVAVSNMHWGILFAPVAVKSKLVESEKEPSLG